MWGSQIHMDVITDLERRYMARYQVTCITKPNRDNTHEAITHLGGDFGYWSVAQVIAAINNQVHSFYTSDGSKEAEVGVRERNGKPYVQTHADGYWNDNLLALQACKAR